MNENTDILNIQPLSSTSSSYSASSCSSASSTSRGNKYQMANNLNSPPVYDQLLPNTQDNLNLVVNDLRQISCTLNLLARQIDQVIQKIDSNGGNVFSQDQKNLQNLKNFTKVINSDLVDKNFNLNKSNSLNRNENIINNYLNNQKIMSERIAKSNSKDLVDSLSWNQSCSRTKYTRSKSQPAFKDSPILISSSTNVCLNRAIEKQISSPITNNNQLITTDNQESSFYEDQLDNELEAIQESNVDLQNMNLPLPNKKEQNPNGIQKSKVKVAGSNHHVSFNINNAIYTSKQETPIPIPISILKQAKMIDHLNSSSSSSSNVSPLQPSMKKSSPVNFNSVSKAENSNLKFTSKPTRLDTKTTNL